MGNMTKEEEIEYDLLTAQVEQLELRLDELSNKPTVYGYARVSSRGQKTDGNSLEAQKHELKANGAEIVYEDVCTGTTTDRPELNRLIEALREGDTIVVTKLDRLARSVQEGSGLIGGLVERGVKVRILNMGNIDNSPAGTLLLNVMLAFAQFERDMIMERTAEGKAISGNYGGRPNKYTDEQIKHAVELLNGSYSYSDVVRMTGISKSTLVRARKRSM